MQILPCHKSTPLSCFQAAILLCRLPSARIQAYYVPASTRNLISNFICAMDDMATRLSPTADVLASPSQRRRKHPFVMLQSGLLGSERVLHVYPVPFSEPCWKFYAYRIARHKDIIILFYSSEACRCKPSRERGELEGSLIFKLLPSYLMPFLKTSRHDQIIPISSAFVSQRSIISRLNQEH